MKKYISRAILAMLLCVILLPLQVYAASEDEIRLDSEGVVTLLSRHAAKEEISTVQLSLSVSSSEASKVEFQFEEAIADIADYRVNKSLDGADSAYKVNLYVAGADALFPNETDALKLGRLVILDSKGNETGAEVEVVEGSLCYVYGSEVKVIEEVSLPGKVVVGILPELSPEPGTMQTPAPSGAPGTTEAPSTSDVPGTTEAPSTSDVPGTTEAPSTSDAPGTTEAPSPSDGPAPTSGPAENAHCVWVKEADGSRYWYENGVKQGTEGRGKEIYDPASDAWYWLDAADGGKMAVNKDVYMESVAGRLAENVDGTGKWVRYDANGHMIKGWDITDAGTYYFDLIYGTMAKGYVVIDGELYCFDQVTGIGTGQPCEWQRVFGWVTMEDGNRYWYEDGVRQGTEGRGKEIYDPSSDAWYWLDAVDGGKMAVSKDVYMESSAGAWAENADGTGKWVRYDANGHMVKGWDITEEGTYYFDLVYGTMAKGTVTIEENRYRFDTITGIQIQAAKRSTRAEAGNKN